MKLSTLQIRAIRILRDYPDDIVMNDGWLTGGHGIKFDLRTIDSLKNKGLINTYGDRCDRISDLGKTCPLEFK